jgi:hypothetical protein
MKTKTELPRIISIIRVILWVASMYFLASCVTMSAKKTDDIETQPAVMTAEKKAVAYAVETMQAGLTKTMTFGPQQTATATPIPSETPAPSVTPSPTLDSRPDPTHWSEWPVVPTISGIAKEIYQKGIQKGNDPHIFSAIGDCQSEPDVFLGIYETKRYWLGQGYEYLQDTINFYNGSFSRKSLSVRDGMSAPSALSPQWADKSQCNTNETPVECELRVRKPSIIFINLGTNWKPGASAKRYEQYLRQIVQAVIDHGTLPILSTKADNVEGDQSINRATANVAHDFDIPLWNFWLSAQSLPNGGLDPKRDNIYLSFPDGWDRRNFTALETLDAIRKAVNP